jgi:hypothetical protein
MVSRAGRAAPIAQLYEIWRAEPFGVKDGLCPVLGLAYILSRRAHLAFYRQDVFQSHLKDLDVEYLVQDPHQIQLRWLELDGIVHHLLIDMIDVVRDIDETRSHGARF